MNEIQIFTSPQFGEIRTAGTSEQPLFCLADVCKALGLNGGSKNVKSRLNTKGVVSINTPTNGGVQQINFITEPNLYKCIFQSRKKEAEIFQDWVTSEVLPSIRKNGGYIAANVEDTPEEIMARALQVANATLARREERLQLENHEKALLIEQQEAQIELQQQSLRESAPKVTYYDTVLQSVNTLTATQVAKQLGMDAAKLNAKLKEAGVLYRQSGQWLLHSPYSTWGLHSTRTQTYTRSDGSVGTSVYTVWSNKGLRFIIALRDNNWNTRKAIKAITGEDAA